jgi:hypothetical protein
MSGALQGADDPLLLLRVDFDKQASTQREGPERFELPYAPVRSTDTGRAYFLVREPPGEEPHWPRWHELSDSEMARDGSLA